MSRLSLLSQTTANDLVVNIGDTPNDKTGDPLRDAFNKIKSSLDRAETNFIELYNTAAADVQIPSQSGNNGKYLTTNGTTLSWGTVASTDTGDITFNASTMSGPQDEILYLRALDSYGVGAGAIEIDPSYGLVLLKGLYPNQYTFTDSDWSSAVHQINGSTNRLNIQGSTNMVNWLTNNISGIEEIRVSWNGGNQRVVQTGLSYGIGGVFIGTGAVAPDTDPTTVTTITIEYYDRSQISVDAGNSTIEINGGVQSSIYVRSKNSITIDSDGNNWSFNNTGDLSVPGNITKASGNLEITAENYVVIDSTNGGQIDIGANQSGEGSGDSGPILMGHAGNTLDIQSGKIRVNSAVPTHSTGALNDVAGLVAFDASYIYYCTADYVTVGGGGGASASLVPNELGQSVNTITIAKGAPPNTNWADPQVGWTLTVNSTTVTVEEITGDVDNLYIVVSGFITLPPTGSITFTEPGGTQPDIWKRVAWSNDTW